MDPTLDNKNRVRPESPPSSGNEDEGKAATVGPREQQSSVPTPSPPSPATTGEGDGSHASNNSTEPTQSRLQELQRELAELKQEKKEAQQELAELQQEKKEVLTTLERLLLVCIIEWTKIAEHPDTPSDLQREARSMYALLHAILTPVCAGSLGHTLSVLGASRCLMEASSSRAKQIMERIKKGDSEEGGGSGEEGSGSSQAEQDGRGDDSV